ncbi:MAG: divergent polysaccharide deacetylase family protein [Rhodospirillaceae bacterium]|nr:MAG: divergent polysaccharide deacetylase family protein [Rhodospirillaceae bacterium]
MASLIGRVLSVLRREQPKDAFGGDDLGDDLYDDEPPRLGRKIALVVSGVLFLGLVGLGVFVYIAGKDAPPPAQVMAPLAGLQMEDADTSGAASGSSAAPPTQTADAVDATDRSAQRRPWLSAAPGQNTAGQNTAPMAAPAPALQPPSKPPVTPPAPAPAPVAKAQPALTPPAPATTLPPVTKPPTPGAVATSPVPAPTPVASPGPPATDSMPSVLSANPATTAMADATPTMPVDVAPGAPERYTEKSEGVGNGRPHLADPALPPVDKSSMSAPPPRFGNLAVMKVKATPATDKSGDKVGKIAVIVQGLGLSEDATDAAVSKLPTAVALSFSPYAHDLSKWLKAAKASGHEVLVEVPMESNTYPAEDPGPLGLMTSLQPKDNADRLNTILKLFPNAIGIDDIMGSKFREAEAPMQDVFTTLKQKNLVYVQGRPGVRIGEPGVPNTIADVVLDERPFRAAIDARLDYAERLAKYQGSAVTVMDAKPVSFERLALWLDQIDKRGVQLTPVSQVLVR